MNYWPAEVCNLAECHLPLFDLIDDLRQTGAATAREYYGCGGFVAHHNTDIWRAATPVDKAGSGMWPMGAAWLCTHLWEHYRFGGDEKFLRKRAYPAMRQAAEFFLDYLVQVPHELHHAERLVTVPSMSPENGYKTFEGTKGRLSYGCTMDIQLINDLFSACIEASRILDADAGFRRKLALALTQLPPMQVSEKTGRLQEWIGDYDQLDPEHRHISHLYGLYPGNQISLEKTPALAAAAKESLIGRGPKGGFGWTYGWKIGCWARLYDSDIAWDNVVGLLSEKTLPNMFDNGPPFQIDGNFGGTAGIAEMLLQSQTGEILLLPALPAAWPAGRVTGLRARGGFEISIEWDGSAMKTATVKSLLGGICRLRYGTTVTQFATRKNRLYTLDGDLKAKRDL
jgi:alpha-L-fucosidase 2